MSKEQKALFFWNWFSSNNKKYLFLNVVEEEEKERLLDEFIAELHKYNEHVFFEIGGHPDADKVELIITAEGNADHFVDVEFLVEQSPLLPAWNVIAFKPSMGADFKTKIGDHEFDPKKIICIPMVNKEFPSAVGIKVCYPDYNNEEKNLFINGTYLMLDVILGEKSVTLDIDYLEVAQTPTDIIDHPFFHLTEIQEYINQRKNQS